VLIYWTIGETPFHKEIMAQRTRRGTPSEWSSYNRGALVVGGGTRHTSRRHTRHKQSSAIVRAPVLKGGEVRGGEETRGELKSMLIWQLQNCPWTDGKHASVENERMRTKE